jgi:hypothetical protein
MNSHPQTVEALPLYASAGLAEPTLDAALGERPSAGLIRRAWSLVRAQAPLVSGSNLMMAFAEAFR